MQTIGTRRWSRALSALIAVIALVAAACSSQTPASSGGSPAASASASASEAGSPAASGSAAAGTKHVSILNKDMTDDEIKAEIQKEGSLIVANWTYTANDEVVNEFQKYVKDTYGVDIKLDYEGSQAPSVYLTNLYAAQKGGNPVPYDVMNIEEPYWADAMTHDAVADFLPSDLVPNQSLVLDQFQHVPTSIAFQSTAFPAVVFSNKNAGWMTKIQDLGDPRLKGKITIPAPGDITAGGFLLNLANELGKDYKDPAQMKQVVDWVVTNIKPNILKVTSDSSEMQQLLHSSAAYAVTFWNSLARLEYFGGNTDAKLLVPAKVLPVNGYQWITKGTTKPVLSQIYVNWRLGKDVQFPNAWPIEHGPWAELSEGFLGPDYVDQVPDWFKADYGKYYPDLDTIKSGFQQVDWAAYNSSSKEWMDYYAQQFGQ